METEIKAEVEDIILGNKSWNQLKNCSTQKPVGHESQLPKGYVLGSGGADRGERKKSFPKW